VGSTSLLFPHVVEKDRTSSLVYSFIRMLILSCGSPLTTSSKYNYLPKGPSPNTVSWGVRASIYDFGGGGEGDINFPSITLSYTVVVPIK